MIFFVARPISNLAWFAAVVPEKYKLWLALDSELSMYLMRATLTTS
jgi:hypothetical protein